MLAGHCQRRWRAVILNGAILAQEGAFRLQFAMRGADRVAETMDLTLDDEPLESFDLGEVLAEGLLAEDDGLPESASFCCP